MFGQARLGKSGGVSPYSFEFSVISRTHSPGSPPEAALQVPLLELWPVSTELCSILSPHLHNLPAFSDISFE